MSDIIKHYEDALNTAFPAGAPIEVFRHWNQARIELSVNRPIAWASPKILDWQTDWFVSPLSRKRTGTHVTPLFKGPVVDRPWVELTDKGVYDLVVSVCADGSAPTFEEFMGDEADPVRRLAADLQKKLKELNHD